MRAAQAHRYIASCTSRAACSAVVPRWPAGLPVDHRHPVEARSRGKHRVDARAHRDAAHRQFDIGLDVGGRARRPFGREEGRLEFASSSAAASSSASLVLPQRHVAVAGLDPCVQRGALLCGERRLDRHWPAQLGGESAPGRASSPRAPTWTRGRATRPVSPARAFGTLRHHRGNFACQRKLRIPRCASKHRRPRSASAGARLLRWGRYPAATGPADARSGQGRRRPEGPPTAPRPRCRVRAAPSRRRRIARSLAARIPGPAEQHVGARARERHVKQPALLVEPVHAGLALEVGDRRGELLVVSAAPRKCHCGSCSRSRRSACGTLPTPSSQAPSV